MIAQVEHFLVNIVNLWIIVWFYLSKFILNEAVWEKKNLFD